MHTKIQQSEHITQHNTQTRILFFTKHCLHIWFYI